MYSFIRLTHFFRRVSPATASSAVRPPWHVSRLSHFNPAPLHVTHTAASTSQYWFLRHLSDISRRAAGRRGPCLLFYPLLECASFSFFMFSISTRPLLSHYPGALPTPATPLRPPGSRMAAIPFRAPPRSPRPAVTPPAGAPGGKGA